MGTGAVAIHRARFAKFVEVRELLSRTPCPDGVLLGVRRDFLFLNRFVVVRPTSKRREIGNTLIVAPTRGGKGLLAISQLLSWKHSVIVNDIKGELFQATAGYRSTLGNVYVLDPTGVGHRYDPLANKTTESQLSAASHRLLFKPNERDPIFTKRAIKMLTQLFLASRMEGRSPLPYVRHLTRLGLIEAAEQLHRLSPELARQFLSTSYERADFTNRFLINSWESLVADMEPLLTETVVKSFAASDVTIEELMLSETPVTIYLRWCEQDIEAHTPLVRLVWGSMIDELATTYDKREGNGCHPVLMLVDEAAVAPIPSLARRASTVVGRRIYLWIAVQSLEQLTAEYTPALAQVLIDNMDTQIFYRQNGLHTAKHISDRSGRQSAYAHSQTLKEGEEQSQGLSEQGIPLITPQEVMQMTPHDIIVFHSNLPPFKARRVDWRHHPTLKQRRNIPAPQLPTLPHIADLPDRPDGGEPSGSPDEFINPDVLPLQEPERKNNQFHMDIFEYRAEKAKEVD